MKTAFITSTGRTGTRFFNHLIDHCVDNAWSLQEPKPAFRRRAGRLIGRGVRLGDVTYFKLPRLYRGLRHREPIYVECNYHLASAMQVVRAAFPDTTIVHIVRDGRDVVTSWLNRNRYITNDHITPDVVGDEGAARRWGEWNPLQKLAWYWTTINRHAEKSQPDLLVRFEDIFGGDPRHLLRVLEAIPDLEYAEREVVAQLDEVQNPTTRRFYPEHAEWPSFWRAQFWEIAGDTMRRFGYE